MPTKIKTKRGTAEIAGTRIIYTPNPGEVGDDSFIYIAETDDGARAESTVIVKITDVFRIKDSAFTIFQGQKKSLDVLRGVEGVALLKTLVKEPRKGKVSFGERVNNLTLFYQAGKDAIGKDIFTFKAKNKRGTEAQANVTITIKKIRTSTDRFEVRNTDKLEMDFESVLKNDDPVLKKIVEIKPK